MVSEILLPGVTTVTAKTDCNRLVLNGLAAGPYGIF